MAGFEVLHLPLSHVLHHHWKNSFMITQQLHICQLMATFVVSFFIILGRWTAIF